MSNFTGILSIISNQSSLNNNLLLLAGTPDPAQAMFAATQFLVKSRNLNSGQLITVSGKKASGVAIIIMDDAQAAAPQLSADSTLAAFGAAAAPSGDLMKSSSNVRSSKTTGKKARTDDGKVKTSKTAAQKQKKSRRERDATKESK